MRVFFLLFLSMSLFAHNLKIFVKQDEKILHVKSYFSTSSPCIECNVSVKTHDGKMFYFKTNKLGQIDIKKSLNPMQITVDASLGHKNSINIKEKFVSQSTDLPYPFWLRILVSLGLILAFFSALRYFKK